MKDYININYIDEISDSFNLAVTYKSLDAKLKEDMKNVCDGCGFTFENMTSNIQIHSDIVNVVDESSICDKEEGDALVTNLKNVPLLIFTADCVPISIIDNVNKAIGLVHAGWRGTYEQISMKTIEKMQELYNSKPEDLVCIIGPSIGPCCYEVSKDLIDKFVDRFEKTTDNIYESHDESVFLNLWSVNKSILKNSGVKEENIHDMNLCTSCRSDEFYSYRKDDKTLGRIGTILEIK
ncbi:peptidoglycan editing factor PgeF [Metaclostridioides mangenotii]|uniref:Purine nucleoside phosphorylase n=1 Tax=Metaclostridioides mangenotii TaxID=1540 RepID=A0ABS4EA30_9FIRM|nr:peptidoglycan editing factor PgeF [Clostridioides mangenotii]MBP1854792.1 YfiH family protein [Clostridioides mangenotii]